MEETSLVLPLRVLDHSALVSAATFAVLAAGMAWTAWKVRLRSALLGAVLFGLAALVSGWSVSAGYFPGINGIPTGGSREPDVSRALVYWALTGLVPFLGAVAVTFVLQRLCWQSADAGRSAP